jgi:regulator of sirC expression with transglutaminase-like and TPR domain
MNRIELPHKELSGFVNLLKDCEEKTIKLISEQLPCFGSKTIEMIDEIVESSKDSILLDNWYYLSRLSLAERLKEWRKQPDLETGLLLIARLMSPGLNEDKYRKVLDAYAERLSFKIKAHHSDLEITNFMNELLFKEENYMGNQVSYYDLGNNFLHTVIDTKTGNPIMLSCIYILLGRRLGIEIQGIGTPGHFIVKLDDKYLDPFFGGREITRDECVVRSQELSVFWRDEYLDPVDDLMIVSRCIRNLVAIYKRQNDLDKASDANNLLKIV